MNAKIKVLLDNLNKLSPSKNKLNIIHSSLWLSSPTLTDLPVLFTELLSILGKNSTLCFPSFTFKNNRKPNAVWNIESTRGETGILSEYVRKDLKSIRTVHPTHSFVLIGKNSSDIAAFTGESTFGSDSTLNNLVELGAQNISFGSGLVGGHSFFHVAEELQKVPYRSFTTLDTPCVLKNGNMHTGAFNYFARNVCLDGKYHENDWDSAWIHLEDKKLIVSIDSEFGMVALSDCKKVLNFMKSKIKFDPFVYAKKCEHHKSNN